MWREGTDNGYSIAVPARTLGKTLYQCTHLPLVPTDEIPRECFNNLFG